MEINSQTNLEKLLEINILKILESYKSILKSSKVPSSQSHILEDSTQAFNIKMHSETILSSCQLLLDMIHEIRIRNFSLEPLLNKSDSIVT